MKKAEGQLLGAIADLGYGEHFGCGAYGPTGRCNSHHGVKLYDAPTANGTHLFALCRVHQFFAERLNWTPIVDSSP